MSSSPAKAMGALAARARKNAKLALILATLWLVLVSRGDAQSMQVPPSVQASLIAKVAGFDRNFAARAGASALVILVQEAGDPESGRAAGESKGALARLPEVGNLPHEELKVSFTSAAALADLVRSKRAAIVYFGPGFAKQVPAITSAFSSLNVLTFGAD